MHDSQQFRHFQFIERRAGSPLSMGRVCANPLFGRDSIVEPDWTCGSSAAATSVKTAEGNSNTEGEVASA